MRRRRRWAAAALIAAVIVIGLWSPLWAPLWRASVVVLDVYSSAIYGANYAASITPKPRRTEEHMTLVDEDVRVTWWIPGAGTRHAAMLVVNGATPFGNDDPETARVSEALARAGYLVMLPQFAFLTDARLERSAPLKVDAAFAAMLRRPDVDPERAGAFGFSVGGGVLFAAAGITGGALARAKYLGALGAFFDIRSYLASVVSGMQLRGGRLERWTPDPEARLKLPLGAAEALGDAADRETVTAAIRASGGPLDPSAPAGLGDEARALWRALSATTYADAIAALDALPAGLRGTYATLSPATRWADIKAPVYWLHDEGDRFEPVSEAESASGAPHEGGTTLHLTRLLSHAAALSQGARQEDAAFWIRELSGLLGFALSVLRRAG